MTPAKELLGRAIEEIKENYLDYQFITHRDVTWVLQKTMRELIKKEGYPLEVYHNYPLGRERQSLKDYELVIVAQGINYRHVLSKEASVELVVRLLFEPSRQREDICEYALPYVLSPMLVDERKELQSLKENRLTRETQLLLIDEGSRHDSAFFEPGTIRKWGDYGDHGLDVSVIELD